MTISAKLSDIGGVEFVVSDPADIDDVGGFSDVITLVGAKTAKFSGGGIMKANTGLIIGMTQIKINTGDAIAPPRTEEVADYIGWTPNGNDVDDDFDTSLGALGMGDSPGNVAVIDYGSVATRKLVLKVQCTANGIDFSGSASEVVYSVSNDNITYGAETVIASASIPPTGDMVGSITVTSTVTFTDSGTQSFRYVKIIGRKIVAAGTRPTTSDVFEATVADSPASTVTIRVRSSDTQDVADGTVLISDQVMNPNESLTFVIPLFLTGIGKFVTLEIVSLTNFGVESTLSDISSIQEV